MANSFEDFQKFGETQLKAAALSYQSITKVLQLIAAATHDYSKNTAETGTAFFERLLGAKLLDLVIQLQTEYARESSADFVAQVTKIRELYSILAKETFKSVETTLGLRLGP